MSEEDTELIGMSPKTLMIFIIIIAAVIIIAGIILTIVKKGLS